MKSSPFFAHPADHIAHFCGRLGSECNRVFLDNNWRVVDHVAAYKRPKVLCQFHHHFAHVLPKKEI